MANEQDRQDPNGVSTPQINPDQRRDIGKGAAFEIAPSQALAELSEADFNAVAPLSTTSGLDAFADPVFMAELREYFAGHGKYPETDEELIDEFFADQTWTNMNTVGALERANYTSDLVDEGETRRLDIMRRMKEVYDTVPAFYEEGGRGVGGLGQIVLAALADPINLVGAGAGGVAARGAMAAGRTAKGAVGVAARRGAAAEAAAGAGAEVTIDALQQINERNITGSEEGYDLGRGAVAAGVGAVAGGLLGGLFGAGGGAIATWGKRGAEIRADALQELGYTPETISKMRAEDVDSILQTQSTEWTPPADAPVSADVTRGIEGEGDEATAAPVSDPSPSPADPDQPAPEEFSPVAAVEDSTVTDDTIVPVADRPEVEALAVVEGRLEYAQNELASARLAELPERQIAIHEQEVANWERWRSILQEQTDEFEAEATPAVRGEDDVPVKRGPGRPPKNPPEAEAGVDAEAEAEVAPKKVRVRAAAKRLADEPTDEAGAELEEAAKELTVAKREKAASKNKSNKSKSKTNKSSKSQANPASQASQASSEPIDPDVIPEGFTEDVWMALPREQRAEIAGFLEDANTSLVDPEAAGRMTPEERAEVLNPAMEAVEEAVASSLDDVPFTTPGVQRQAREAGLTPQDFVDLAGPPASRDGSFTAAQVREVAKTKTDMPAPAAPEAGGFAGWRSPAQAEAGRKILAKYGKDEAWLSDVVAELGETQGWVASGSGQLTRNGLKSIRDALATDGDIKLPAKKTKSKAKATKAEAPKTRAKKAKRKSAKVVSEYASDKEVADTLSQIHSAMEAEGVPPEMLNTLWATDSEIVRRMIMELAPENGERVIRTLDSTDTPPTLAMREGRVPRDYDAPLTDVELDLIDEMTRRAMKEFMDEHSETDMWQSMSSTMRTRVLDPMREAKRAYFETAVRHARARQTGDKKATTRTGPLANEGRLPTPEDARLKRPGRDIGDGRTITDRLAPDEKAARMATDQNLPMGISNVRHYAKTIKANGPVKFIMERGESLRDGGVAKSAREAWFNPLGGPGHGAYSSENAAWKAINGVKPSRMNADPDVPSSPTLALLRDATKAYKDGEVDLKGFLKRIRQVDLPTAGAQAARLPDDIVPVNEAGEILALRAKEEYIPKTGKPFLPIRVITEKQLARIEEGDLPSTSGLQMLLGKSKMDDWEVGYVPRGTKPNTKAAAEGFKPRRADGTARAYLTAAEASDMTLIGVDDDEIASLGDMIAQLPVDMKNRRGPLDPSVIWGSFVAKQMTGEATHWDLHRTIMTLDQTMTWPRTTTKSEGAANAADIMIGLLTFQKRVSPDPIRTDKLTIEESIASLENIRSMLADEDVLELERMVNDLSEKAGGAPEFLASSSEASYTHILGNKQFIAPASENAPFPFSRIYPAVHELFHWAYQHVLTIDDRIEFMNIIKSNYLDQTGNVSNAALDDRVPIPMSVYERVGAAPSNAWDSPAELFANQGMMWATRNYMDKSYRSGPKAKGRFIENATASKFWNRMKNYVQEIISRFFFDRNAVDEDMSRIFARILPDPKQAALETSNTPEPVTDAGRAIYRRITEVRMLSSELEDALETGNPESIVNSAADLARTLYGVAADGRQKQHPSLKLLADGVQQARYLYGVIFKQLGVEDESAIATGIREGFDFDFQVMDYEGIAEKLQSALQSRLKDPNKADQTTSFLEGNTRVWLRKARAKLNQVEPEVVMDDEFLLQPKNTDPRAVAYRNYKRDIGRRRKSARKAAEAKAADIQTKASKTKPGPAIEMREGTVSSRGLDLRQKSSIELGEILRRERASGDGDTVISANALRELSYRENTQQVHDLPRQYVRTPEIAQAISRERQHSIGAASDNVSPNASADVRDVQSQLTHRDPRVESAMRSIFYRMANLTGVADASDGAGNVSETAATIISRMAQLAGSDGNDFSVFRSQIRKIATQLQARPNSDDAVPNPQKPVGQIIDALAEYPRALDIRSRDMAIIKKNTLDYLASRDESILDNLDTDEADAVIRMTDAVAYVVNGATGKSARRALPNLDRYGNMVREDDLFLEMSEGTIADVNLPVRERIDLMSNPAEALRKHWRTMSPDEKSNVAKWLNKTPDDDFQQNGPPIWFEVPGGRGSQKSSVYGDGDKIAVSSWHATDIHSLSVDAPERVRAYVAARLANEEADNTQEFDFLTDMLRDRRDALRDAARWRAKAMDERFYGETETAVTALSRAKTHEEIAAKLTSDLENGHVFVLDDGSQVKVRGLKEHGLSAYPANPVYARVERPAPFTSRHKYAIPGDDADPAAQQSWNDVIGPILQYASETQKLNVRGTRDLMGELRRIARTGGVRQMMDPRTLEPAGAERGGANVIDGRDMFQVLSRFLGNGNAEQGRSTLRLILKGVGYDGIAGSKKIDGVSLAAEAGLANTFESAGRLTSDVDFVMPLEPRRQVRGAFDDFRPRPEDDLNNGPVLSMDEGARAANPAILKTLASEDKLRAEDAAKIANAFQSMGAQPEEASGMMKMLKGRYPGTNESKALRRAWRGVFTSGADYLRRENMNWFANWVSPDRFEGSGHFERLASRTGQYVAPMFDALAKLPGAGNPVKNWARKATDFAIPGLQRQQPGTNARQPESYTKLVRALRQGPGSDAENALTEQEKAVYREARKFFRDIHKEQVDAGVMTGNIENYFPQVWNTEKIQQNFPEFQTALARYFMEEARVNQNISMDPRVALGKAERIAGRLIDDEGMYVPPPGGGSRAPAGDHIDFQRLIRLDKFQKHLDDVGRFLEDDLGAIVAKYADTSMRRVDFAEKFGEQSHAFHEYLSVLSDQKDGREVVAKLLQTNKVSRFTLRKGGMDENPDDEIIIERMTVMPFGGINSNAENQAQRAWNAADEAFNRHKDSGEEAARAYLMGLLPQNAPAEARAIYAKRVDAIVGAMTDRAANGGKPMDAQVILRAQESMRSIQRRAPSAQTSGFQFMNGTSKLMRNITSMTLLGFTTLTSLGDPMLPLIKSGNMKAFGKALSNWSAQPEYRAMIRNTGVAIESIVHERMTNLYGAEASRNTVAFFNLTGLTPWTTMQREWAGAIGYEWFKAEYDIALKAFDPNKPLPQQSPRFKKAFRVLRQYGLDGVLGDAVNINQASLQDLPQLRTAIIKFANEAIFTPNPNDIPLWAQSPIGQMVFQLKSFPLMMARYAKDVWRNASEVDPITKGGRRFSPALMFLSAGPLFNAGTLGVKDIVQARGEEDSRTFRERRLSKAAGELGIEAEFGDQFDQMAGWYWEGFMMMGGLGLIGELMHDSAVQSDQGGAYGAMRFFTNIGGPSSGLAWGAFDVASGTHNALTHGSEDGNAKERAAARAVASRIPIAGGLRDVREAITERVGGEAQSGGRKKSWGDGWGDGGWGESDWDNGGDW